MTPNPKLHRKLALAGIALAGIVALGASQSSVASVNSQVDFIDVGQGDAILLRDGNGFDVLVDGGKPSAGPTVLAYLRSQGLADLDVLVASHADSDHIGGLIDVLEAGDIPVLQVLYNGYPGNTATWNAFATAVSDEGMTPAPAQYPDEFVWGGMTARVLNPVGGLVNPDQNNASVVLLVEHGSVGFLLTGDIDSTAEADIVARGTPVAAEILKVAHHGSQYSSGADFLAAATLTDRRIETIEQFTADVGEGLDAATFADKRHYLAWLDVSARLAVEDGEKAMYVRVKVMGKREHRLSVDSTPRPRCRC